MDRSNGRFVGTLAGGFWILLAELFRFSGCCTLDRFDEACVLTALPSMVAWRKASVGLVKATLGEGKQQATWSNDIRGKRVMLAVCLCAQRPYLAMVMAVKREKYSRGRVKEVEH